MLSLRTGRRLCRPPSMVCSLLLMGYCRLLIVWYLFVLLSRSRRLVSLSSSSSPKSSSSSLYRSVSPSCWPRLVPLFSFSSPKSSSFPKSFSSSLCHSVFPSRWRTPCCPGRPLSPVARGCRWHFRPSPPVQGGLPHLAASLRKEHLLLANIRQKVFTKKKNVKSF